LARPVHLQDQRQFYAHTKVDKQPPQFKTI